MCQRIYEELGYGFAVRKEMYDDKSNGPCYRWENYIPLSNMVVFLSNHKEVLKNKELMVLEALLKILDGNVVLQHPIENYMFEKMLEEIYKDKNPLKEIKRDGIIGEDQKAETIIANVISRETDIPIGYFEGTNEDIGCIMYCSGYPWDMSEGEKKLNGKNGKKDLEKILNKYRDELIDEQYKSFAEVGYQSVEYWD